MVKTKKIILFMLAVFLMFIPRHLKIASVYGYRFIIILISFFSVTTVLNARLKIYGLITKSYYIFYLFYMCFCYIIHFEIISMIGFIIDNFLLYIIFISLIDTEEDLLDYIRYFLLFLIFYCSLCIVESLTGFNIWSLFDASVQRGATRYGIIRAYGSFTTSINNGVFLMLSFFTIWFGMNHESTRFISRITYPFVWIALFCTVSRGPILCAVILHLLWFFGEGVGGYIKAHFKGIFFAIIILSLLLLFPAVRKIVINFSNMFVAVFDSNVADSIKDSFGSNANGIGQRLYLYNWVWDSLSSLGNIWIGMGPNALFNYVWTTTQGSTRVKQSIENFYLSTLYREGIIGLISIVFFFTGTLISIWKRYKYDVVVLQLKRFASVYYRILTTLFCYFAVLFTVSAADDYRFMFVILAIGDALYYDICNSQSNE